ncbi:MAG: hypothetical protein A2Z60_02735 [Nitrospirae bacterium RIFCSPLOWO2_02_42_7]|nr:MAG: hypothetical protein A2Z60_02735 [Nitrospirae bacterium RIFCSPLOWO2_02_42_7]
MCGSGTTIDVAKELNRKVVGYDLNVARPDVIKNADYIIDLGPEGGDDGGEIVAYGTPEEVAAVEQSYTGKLLRNILAN